MRLAFRRSPDSADSPPYLPLLKLHSPPFASQSAAAFFYADAEREQYLNMLQHLTQYSEELLLIAGEEGMGKSALLEKYLERTEEHWRLCRLDAAQGVDPDKLFSRIAECFSVDLSGSDPASLLDTLRQHFETLLEQQLPVLVIDDAQGLSDDALEMALHLAALEGEHGKLIRVLLFAAPGLEKRLDAERFSAITTPHLLQLKPLNEADTSAYVLHRLQQAGLGGALPLSGGELKDIFRQSKGAPAAINHAAHMALLQQFEAAGGGAGLSGKGIRLGIAATALIGTVLGMHERINAFLGGDAHNSMGVSVDRPVLRLADQDNPWAVVIRDGESIQISCGPPGEEATAVRPQPAIQAAEQQTVMKAPLMKPVATPQEEPQADSAVEAGSPEKDDEAAAPQDVKPPLPAISPELPLSEEQAPKPPEKLTLNSVSPTPVVGSDKPQTITILGSGFVAESKVAVSWAGKVKALEPSQILVRDSGHMELTLETGVEANTWAVQVSTPDKKRSNILRFKVEKPGPQELQEAEKVKPQEQQPEAVKPTEEKSADTPAEAQAAPKPKTPALVVKEEAAEPKPVPVAEKAPAEKEPAEPVKKKSVATKPAVASRPVVSKTVGSGAAVKGAAWIQAQPGGNYTMQLLAVGDSKSIDDFVSAHSDLKAPLARFMQQRDGKSLHVLTQGSYKTRAQAETAARDLPGKVKPWIRNFAGIKKVMTAPATAATTPSGGGIKDTAWVWSQNPTHHTIQLAGATDEVSIQAVMRGLKLPGELAVVKTLRNGKPWYTLIYGRFADKAAAQGTVSRLPGKLRKAGPWIRRFSALQDEIGQAANR